MTHWRTAGLLILCLAAAYGCRKSAIDYAVKPPTADLLGLNGMRVEGLTPASRARLKLGNPNPGPVEIVGVSLTIRVNDAPFASGMRGVEAGIEAFGERVVEIPITLSNVGALRALTGTAKTGKIRYTCTAEVTFLDETGKRHSDTITREGDMGKSVFLQ